MSITANPNFDAEVYGSIFGDTRPEVAFVSAGSCSEVENKENTTINSITQLLHGSKITKVVDRDDLSEEEVDALLRDGILSLTRCGNTRESFIKNTILPLITPDTNVYKELEQSIFGSV